MKKVLLISALVLTIVTSMVTGTLAVYQLSLEDALEGEVTAKEFILLAAGVTGFEEAVLIAPSETVTMEFTVANNDGTIVSEVPMDVDVEVAFVAADGKAVIVPLQARLLDGASAELDTDALADGTGSLEASVSFPASADSATFVIEITWPTGQGNAIDFAGSGFGTAVNVSIVGTQDIT